MLSKTEVVVGGEILPVIVGGSEVGDSGGGRGSALETAFIDAQAVLLHLLDVLKGRSVPTEDVLSLGIGQEGG